MNMMAPSPDVFDLYSSLFESRKQTEMSLRDYFTLCRETPTTFANAAERMLTAIGEPEVVDTSTDARLGRIFMNRSIKRYPTFRDFYGMEETIERIVGFFKHAAQGLEERKQILYLLGPVGGGKSSLAERLKSLMEQMPIYALKAGDQISLACGVRIAARPVRPGAARAVVGRPLRHSAALSHGPDVALGGQAGGRIRRRHLEVHGRAAEPLEAQPDLRGQDRTRRR